MGYDLIILRTSHEPGGNALPSEYDLSRLTMR